MISRTEAHVLLAKHGLSGKRLVHSTGVSEFAYRMALPRHLALEKELMELAR